MFCVISAALTALHPSFHTAHPFVSLLNPALLVGNAVSKLVLPAFVWQPWPSAPIPLTFQSPRPHPPRLPQYQRSKLANLVFAAELARRWSTPPLGIQSYGGVCACLRSMPALDYYRVMAAWVGCTHLGAHCVGSHWCVWCRGCLWVKIRGWAGMWLRHSSPKLPKSSRVRWWVQGEGTNGVFLGHSCLRPCMQWDVRGGLRCPKQIALQQPASESC